MTITAYRLTTETVTTGTDIVVTSYTYDDAHNRTSKVVEKNSTVEETNLYTFNNNLNQIDSFTDGNRTVSFTYDLNGNRILRVEEDNQQTVTGYSHYVYDQENRLISLAIWNSEPILDANGLPEMLNGEYVTTPGELYVYDYDYRTRRVARTENGETTLLTFSAGLSVREYLVNGQGTPELQVEFIRGSDYGGGVGGILYSLRDGIPSYAHYNRRGDVVARTDESGSLTYQSSYEAFGRHGDTPGTEEWGDSPDRQRANTKEEDPTGLLNEGFRYRCLETGVFLTRDPLGFVDGPNVYTYVVQNPWTKFDPEGLSMRERGRSQERARRAPQREQRSAAANARRWEREVPSESARQRHLEYAKLARAVYADDNIGDGLPTGWRHVDPNDLGLTSNDFHHSSSGFHSALYRHDDGSIAWVFRGTEGADWKDWNTNIKSAAFGRKDGQYRAADDLAERIIDQFGRGNLTAVGHSLGGGLASTMGIKHQMDFVTFNSKGAHHRITETSRRTRNRLGAQYGTAYRVGGEVLYNGQRLPIIPQAVGNRINLSPTVSRRGPVTSHSMDMMIQTMQDSMP